MRHSNGNTRIGANAIVTFSTIAFAALIVITLTARDAAALPEQVLIAGGDAIAGPSPPSLISTAELYDPKSGSFSRTLGNMNDEHFASLATRLRNGNVLFTGGGLNGDEFNAKSELYDPATQRFIDLGNAQGRGVHVSELLKSGDVLVAGGAICCLSLSYRADAELFDPKSSRFTATGSMSITRAAAQSEVLANGQVLVAGGLTGMGSFPGFETTSSTELYDPKTGAFNPTGSLPAATAGGTATLLNNGQVLIAGGTGTLGATNAAELYDPMTGTFAATGNMLVARANSPVDSLFGTAYTATLLKNGQVLMAGGVDSTSGTRIDSAELYNPKTGQFTATGNLTTPRAGHTATLLANGDVLIACGDAVGNAAELYHPETGTFSPTGNLTTARPSNPAAVLLGP